MAVLKVLSRNVRLLDDDVIRLDKLRLSYPKLWHADAGNFDDGPGIPQFSAEGIWPIAEYKDDIQALRGLIHAFSKEHFKDSNGTTGIVIPAEKHCFRTGNGSGKPEREGAWVIKAAERNKPAVLGQGGVPVEEADGVLYAGCYVSMLIRLWALNGHGKPSKNPKALKAGKRIGANLLGVRFMSDGEPFSQIRRPAMNEAFSDLDTAEADDEIPL